MISGIPCIATDVGESKNIIDGFGWIVPPNNPKLLSKSIIGAINLFSNSNKYSILSNKCHNHIITNFSEKIMIKKYNDMYQNL